VCRVIAAITAAIMLSDPLRCGTSNKRDRLRIDKRKQEPIGTGYFPPCSHLQRNPWNKLTADALASRSAPARRRPGSEMGVTDGSVIYQTHPPRTNSRMSDIFCKLVLHGSVSSASLTGVKRGCSHLPFMFTPLPCRTRTGLGLPHSLELTPLRQRAVRSDAKSEVVIP
jgi:hypothetical protein